MSIAQYTFELQTYLRVTGHLPLVAIIGREDYEELNAELTTLFSQGLPLIVTEEKLKLNIYNGVVIFQNMMRPHGIAFGGTR